MSRGPRELYSNQYFHLICRSNNKIFVFKDSDDFQKYLGLLHHHFLKNKVLCFHYALMNTHVHIVVKLPENVKGIPQMMKEINLKYCLYYKWKYGFEGNLWRDRYRSALIDTDRYMLGCGLYVEHNPVKAGIVANPDEYPWSSYGHWTGTRNDLMLSEHPLGDVVKKYKEISQDYIDAYTEYIKLTKIPVGRPKSKHLLTV
jgi:putative transposase